jgi:hypothetical protein
MINRLPFWAEFRSVPDEEIALIPDWDAKMNKIVETASAADVRSLVGIPSWFQTLLMKLLKRTGAQTVSEIWPDLEVFFHGGIHFGPYKEGFKKIIGKDRMHYMEIYNASEGFFGLQSDLTRPEFLLMLDYWNYFEFIPMQNFDGIHSGRVLQLDEVETGVNYAPVITNASGLWRYILGDTIRFVSTRPYKFVITGRTKHFINIVGEEVIVDNTEKALEYASRKHDTVIKNYTVAPVFMKDDEKGAHEWLIEFEKAPENPEAFAEDLDRYLQQINSDYEIKRKHDISLKRLVLHMARPGLFEDWLRKHNKIGGQHKIPRLSQNRDLIEELFILNREK